MDAQALDKPRAMARQAGATFDVALDPSQSLWQLYHFRTVPSAFVVDEQGTLRYMKLGEFDIRNPRDARAVGDVLAGSAKDCPDLISPKGCEFFRSIDLGSWRSFPQ
jgi:hypothetical protein